MIIKAISCFLFLFGLFSCATPNLPPVGREKSFLVEGDERRLWNRAAEMQNKIDKSGLIYEDPDFIAYINEVSQKLVPEEVKGQGLSIRIRVIKNPLINAFALPDGVIYVHTGIISKMENEAQLAILLAHEMTHIIHRHSVKEFRDVKSKTAFWATLQVTAAPFGVFGSIASLMGGLGTLVAVTGYSRELETEADVEGLRLVIQAGYNPSESLKLFQQVRKDLEEQKIKEPFFFGSHPRVQERIDNYTEILKSADKKGEKGEDRFMEKSNKLFLDNAILDLSMGRFNSARRSIETFLKRSPESPIAHYLLGETYRQWEEAGNLDKAGREYLFAIQCDPSYPEAHKGLGIVHYRQGKKEEARMEFEKYRTLAPKALDRAYIEQYLRELKNELE